MTTATTITPTSPSTGRRLTVLVAAALHLVAGVFVMSSGLLMPAWAVVLMGAVWVTGLIVLVHHRQRPFVTVLVPVMTTAIWFLTGWAGETFLGWSG